MQQEASDSNKTPYFQPPFQRYGEPLIASLTGSRTRLSALRTSGFARAVIASHITGQQVTATRCPGGVRVRAVHSPCWRKQTVMAQVLLVDDDPALRGLLHAVLRGDGHKILEASDGAEALATLGESVAPLIVLLDWQMPRLDGFGVLRAVAADPRLRALHRFLLVTAADWQDDPEHTALLEQLHVPVIPKPFDLAAMSEVVEQAATGLAAA